MIANTLVGFRHHVIDWHALFNSGSMFLAWDNDTQTGDAYSAATMLMTNAI